MATTALERWVHDFVEGALQQAEVEEFVRHVDAEILAGVPEVAADPGLVEELHASTRAHWRNFLVSLGDDYQLSLPPAAVALSLSIARRQLDINVLLKVYRMANMGVFRHLTEHTEADRLPEGLPRDEVLIHLWNRASRWIEDSIEMLIDDFTAERERLQEGAMARRAEVIETLVSGGVPDQDVERALGHPIDRWQTAFVLWSPHSEAGGPSLYDAALRLCQESGVPRPLTNLAGSRELWGWVATASEPSGDLGDAADLVADLGLLLAVGRPGRGLSGFRTSHLQAVAAQHLGSGSVPAVRDYRDVELLALIGDTELARELVQREAGPLLGHRRSDEAVRATVLTHLRNGQDVGATARTQFIHPNTVRYRVARAEESLERRITERPAELEVALAWVAWHGVDALE